MAPTGTPMAAAASSAVRVPSGKRRGSMVIPAAAAPATTASVLGCALSDIAPTPCQNPGVRDWVVAGGLVEGPDGLLLVQNRRRDGSLDWSPPGGVIEISDGESVTDGLSREVLEETGLRVDDWDGPVYSVEA